MNQLKYRVLGMMSGTSLDGLDLCFAEFWKKHDSWKFKLINSNTISYPNYLLNKLKQAYSSTGSILHEIDKQYGQFLGESALKFLHDVDAPVDFIASHGHTVYHDPANRKTVQIGNGPELHNTTGIPVICDFRVQDVLLGGQGAPLVPIGDDLLFGEYGACLNLGGFANISFGRNGQRMAFDICPANIVLNDLSQKLGYDYDENGQLARSGQVDFELLGKLNQLDYYAATPPKSLGREWVEDHIDPLLKGFDSYHALSTFTEHVATQIAASTVHLNGKMLVTGGGSFNTYLIERIQHFCQNKLVIPDHDLINYKEALIFGFLGVLRYTNQPNCLASVTGAKANHSAGKIYR